MLLNPLYEVSWKKKILSYVSSSGDVIPKKQRIELLNYLNEGTIPSGFLRALLENDLYGAFKVASHPLEKKRVYAIYEFIKDVLPFAMYGSEDKVLEFANLVQSGALRKTQEAYHRGSVSNPQQVVAID